MRGQRRWTLLIAAGGLATHIAGCKSFFAPRGIPQDPLLLARPPIESRGQVTPLAAPVHREPQRPPNPADR